MLAAALALAFLFRDVPQQEIDIVVPLMVGTLIVGVLVAATWSSPRLESGLSRAGRRAIVDISFAEYASLVSFAAGAFLLRSVVDGAPGALVTAEIGSGALALAVLLLVQARRWSRRFRRRGMYERARLMGMSAPVASLLVVGFWVVLATYSDTLYYAGRLARHGEVSGALPARLRTSTITCVRLQWLGEDRPPIPEHALHVGQAGGTAVFYVPEQGPLRLPAVRVALLPAPNERCRVP